MFECFTEIGKLGEKNPEMFATIFQVHMLFIT